MSAENTGRHHRVQQDLRVLIMPSGCLIIIIIIIIIITIIIISQGFTMLPCLEGNSRRDQVGLELMAILLPLPLKCAGLQILVSTPNLGDTKLFNSALSRHRQGGEKLNQRPTQNPGFIMRPWARHRPSWDLASSFIKREAEGL